MLPLRLLCCTSILSLVTACAHPTVAPQQQQALLRRYRAQAAPPQVLDAEARITAFSTAGRLRATAGVQLLRPSALRADLVGPHGGLVLALATDGTQLQLLDVSHNRFVSTAATPAHLAELLGLHAELGVAQWLDLLLGVLPIPAAAQLRGTAGGVRAQWDADAWQMVAVLDEDARLRCVQLQPHQDAAARLVVHFDEPDASGLMQRLVVQLRRQGQDEELRLQLRDITRDGAPPPAETFVLTPPAGMAVHAR